MTGTGEIRTIQKGRDGNRVCLLSPAYRPGHTCYIDHLHCGPAGIPGRVLVRAGPMSECLVRIVANP